MTFSPTDSVQILGSAPAKIILFGEHAVLYGYQALGFALSRGVNIQMRAGEGRVFTKFSHELHTATESGQSTPDPLVRKALGASFGDLDVDITFEVPVSGGLGSSAALATALIRASLTKDKKVADPMEVLRKAMEVEDVAHGKSSGLDPAICVYGGLVSFKRTSAEDFQVQHLELKESFHLVIGVYGSHGGTSRRIKAVTKLRKIYPAAIDSAMKTLGHCADWGIKAIQAGDLHSTGHAMDLAHGVLSGMGLVGHTIEQMARAARHEGAYGAKMSGSGGEGGAVVALVPDIQTGNQISMRWRELGAETWIETAS